MDSEVSCITCGTSWDQPEKHAKVCLIGEGVLMSEQDDLVPARRSGFKIMNQSLYGRVNKPFDKRDEEYAKSIC